jgi:hypothetical protein
MLEISVSYIAGSEGVEPLVISLGKASCADSVTAPAARPLPFRTFGVLE